MRAFKLTDGIDISGENYTEKQLSSNSKEDDEGKNLELPTTMPMVASTSGDDLNNFEKTYV